LAAAIALIAAWMSRPEAHNVDEGAPEPSGQLLGRGQLGRSAAGS
jgi:hypothetical protein